MASEITHIVLPSKIYATLLGKPEPRAFFVGTLIPDIRYLGAAKRSDFHAASPVLSVIRRRSDPFRAGMDFHALLDAVREDFMRRSSTYQRIPVSPYATQTLKLLEDEIFYPHIGNWHDISAYLDALLPQESSLGIAESHLLRWHKILQLYFAAPPSDASREKLISSLGLGQDAVKEIKRDLAIIRKDTEVISAVHALYDRFEELLDKHEKSALS